MRRPDLSAWPARDAHPPLSDCGDRGLRPRDDEPVAEDAGEETENRSATLARTPRVALVRGCHRGCREELKQAKNQKRPAKQSEHEPSGRHRAG